MLPCNSCETFTYRHSVALAELTVYLEFSLYTAAYLN